VQSTQYAEYADAKLHQFFCFHSSTLSKIMDTAGATEPVPQVPRPWDQCWKQNYESH